MRSQRIRSSLAEAPIYNPADSVGRHFRWQVLLACLGLFVLVGLLGYSTYSITTVLVPDRGGVYREGVVGNPRYLNPFVCDRNPVDEDICHLIFRGLTKIDRQGRPVPDIAAEWTITDNTIYTFRLRGDQFWHDGRPITADDVVFTASILQNPDVVEIPNLSILWRTITVEKLDDYTVRFTLAEASPFLDYTTIGLLPVHIYGSIPQTELASRPLNGVPVGSGAMKVDEIAADHITLRPSPYYTGKQPYLSALEFRFYPDYPSLLNGYLAGEIDGVSRILPTEFELASKQEDLLLFSAMQARYVSVVLNLDNPNVPFFAEKAVRQALYYSLNRETIINEVAAGQGVVADTPLLPENWAYNPNIERYRYNPDRARELLDEAGWIDSDGDGYREKDGLILQFLLYSPDDPFQSRLIQRIAQDWDAIGVHAVPTPVSFVTLMSDYLLPRNYDSALITLDIPGDPDQYWLWHSSQIEQGGFNYAGWRNEEVDALLQQARSITNEAERRALYWRFQEIFVEEAPSLLLFYPVYTYGVNERIHDVQMGPLNRPADRFDNFADWYMVTRRVPANQVPTGIPPTPPSQVSP